MKKSFFSTLFFISFFPLFKSQEKKEVYKNEKSIRYLTANKWIEKALDKIKNQQNAQLDFTYRLSDNYSLKKGVLFLSKNKYHLSTKELIQICDGEKVYTIRNEDKEIIITHKDLSGSISIVEKLDIYKENYIPKIGITKKYRAKDKTRVIQSIEFYPKKKSTYKENFLIEINSSTFQIDQIIGSYMKESFRIIIDKWNENTKLEKELFKFDKSDKEKYENFGYTITQLD